MKKFKSKIAAFFIIISLIIGGAAAQTTASFTITDDPITIYVGESKTQTVTITLDPVVANAISKIEIIDLPVGIESSIDGTPGTVLTGLWTSPKTWNVKLTNVGATNGVYTITYKPTYVNDDKTPQIRRATIEAGINAIPEFPTVALPVAAMIGLVFLFQHRKNKKD